MSNKILYIIASIAIILLIAIALLNNTGRGKITIYVAGSLKIPLDRIGGIYRAKTGVNYYLEVGGSVDVIRKITELHRKPDIVFVADYKLLKQYLYPKYIDWYIGFASNQVVLAYTDKSKYSDLVEKNPSKWYEVLMRKSVRYGFSDPNKDPCGYRSVGLLVLAGIYYNDSSIYGKLLLNKTDIELEKINDTYHVYVKPVISIKDNSLVIRAKSIDLIALLEAGEIDYAFEYKSVAIQHGLKYIELPEEISLGDPRYEEYYQKIILHLMNGSSEEKTIRLSSIVYGVAILKNTANYEKAIEFLETLFSSDGRRVFMECGQPILEKPIIYGKPPSKILGLINRGVDNV